MHYWLYLLPAISALVGYLLNRIAIGYFFNSYLPKRDNAWAQQLGKIAAEQTSGSINLEEKISDPALIEKAMPAIEAHIDEFLNVKLKEEIPMLAMFVGTKTTDKIKEVFINQLRLLFPQVMQQIAGGLKEKLNIEQLVSRKLKDTPLSFILKKELAGIAQNFPWLGAFFGLIIGGINLALICFILGNLL
ncbi:hypothetical protein [Niabella soli]|uniref:DUF445 domain-containing protein n=1 Tax=Niabella soli DSM 19437 TaxID=929713 RepID=W0F688_9BACT|nr:hypothetical protein [Niabella soli]AHF17318.1 hypothetical protein NIASO_05650 [Niabella soli DSM 19437]